MRAYELIAKKRDGGKLSKEEIEFFIDGYTNGSIPDYQAAAMNMAMFLQGLDSEETAQLTMAMVNSGDQFDLSGIKGVKVDKHSTGGVGDTTTLVLGPWVAAAGAPMAKMSGRGLGHTGGTLDKLEAIPGFDIEMDAKQFVDAVNEIGVAVVGQTGNLVPADKKLYALRDVTATVESIPLIAGSIMSKKIAAGADAIVLDVKVGSGAFMKTEDDAFNLARTLVEIGSKVGRTTVAVITSMDQPLGYAVGNALEVQEAIDTLQDKGPSDLNGLCVVLGSYMLQLAGIVPDAESGEKRMKQVVKDGSALKKFQDMIRYQKGNPAIIEQPELLPQAKFSRELRAQSTGYVQRIEAEDIGLAAMIMGAGRATKEDVIDFGAGVVLKKKVGDSVQPGEAIAILYGSDVVKMDLAETKVLSAYVIGSDQPKEIPLVYGVVTENGEKRFT